MVSFVFSIVREILTSLTGFLVNQSVELQSTLDISCNTLLPTTYCLNISGHPSSGEYQRTKTTSQFSTCVRLTHGDGRGEIVDTVRQLSSLPNFPQSLPEFSKAFEGQRFRWLRLFNERMLKTKYDC